MELSVSLDPSSQQLKKALLLNPCHFPNGLMVLSYCHTFNELIIDFMNIYECATVLM